MTADTTTRFAHADRLSVEAEAGRRGRETEGPRALLRLFRETVRRISLHLSSPSGRATSEETDGVA